MLVFGGLAILLFVFVAFLLTHNSGASPYDQIGAGGLSREGEFVAAQRPPRGSAAEQLEREQEVRQMLRARSERQVRAGRPAIDVESELSRLLAGEQAQHGASRTHDAELLAEVRQLVLARNERRVRQGLQALDVDSEVRRTLEELES